MKAWWLAWLAVVLPSGVSLASCAETGDVFNHSSGSGSNTGGNATAAGGSSSQGASTTTSATGAAGAGPGPSTTSSSSTGVPVCGGETMPDATCDPSCDQCVNGICIFDCNSNANCQNSTIICPIGDGCQVSCSNGGCTNTNVTCPLGFVCFVDCIGDNACNGLTVTCDPSPLTGPCQLRCQPGFSVCAGAQLNCGLNLCGAICTGLIDPPPTVQCGQSCQCAQCS